ncbi:MAG TPA: class A beta-lactamase [Paraburkholderia sp.]|jgi:beta-lactamase class A|nr:class A beta-lactamase [Paraburkholderia sp.]
MTHSPARRALLAAAATVPLVSACGYWPFRRGAAANPAERQLAELEAAHGGRLGVYALNTGNGKQLAHRADQRFAFCSTFKVMAVAAMLRRSSKDPGLMDEHIIYGIDSLVPNSPVTSKHLGGDGLSIADLCAAALQYSDNAAANLLLREAGGLSTVNDFARSIGDDTFRLDRWEPTLNEALPNDWRDTSTPQAMAKSLQKIALGDALGAPQRQQLITWMRGNTTGNQRIRAGVPQGWSVADKTGTGDYGTTNDLALAWPPGKPPLAIALYYTQDQNDASANSEVLAAATRIAVQAIA